MGGSFDIVTLAGDLIPETLPLIRATWPGIDLSDWRTFVDSLSTSSGISGPSGALVLRDQACCLCGLLAYRFEQDLLEGTVLYVRLFTVADIANSPLTVKALLDGAEARARELGCESVWIRLQNGQTVLASRLRSLGLFSRNDFLFSKKVDAGRSWN